MRYVLAVGCAFVALAVAVSAGEVDGKKIVGKWTMKKGDDIVSAEFTKDGKLNITHKERDTEFKMKGTYEISKDKITVTFEKDGKKSSDTGTIEKLTADTLIILGEKSKDRMEFKRAK